MKILYIFTSPSLKGSSVQTKVLNQIKYLNIAGADCRGAFFSTEVTEKTPLNEFADLIPVEKCTWKYFRASGQKRKTMQAVLNYAKENYSSTDYFYFRYPGAGSLLQKFTRNYGNKTIFEHLSIEEFEIKLHAKENPFGLKPSKLFSWLEYAALPLWRESLFGKTIRKNARMGICNSQEIADFQIQKSEKKYKCIAGGDSVEIESYPLFNRPILKDELRMVFLKGASTNADFNGLDRFIKSISDYKGAYNLKLFILGHQLESEKRIIKQFNLNESIELLSPKKGKELFDFLKEMHLGIATLGLFRKGLNSTTTIKVREYTALGLPFIYAYTDTDLNEEAKSFSLQFPNDKSMIDIQQVIDFAQKALADSGLPQKMRKYAEEHLGYKIKMERLYKELLQLQDEN